MEEFYTLLKAYNRKLDYSKLPDWTRIYAEDQPPIYWTKVYEALQVLPKNFSVFEIGSGTGDILALIKHMGFERLMGIERDPDLAETANKKLYKLFGLEDIVLTGNYPTPIPSPGILVQVNCVYFEGITKKEEYIKQLVDFYEWVNPEHYLVEVIDSSYMALSKVFPNFIRLSEEDIRKGFPGLNIQSYITYQYPKNTSTKRLYLISK